MRRRPVLVLAAAAAVVLAVVALLGLGHPVELLHAWLAAFVLAIGLPLGCLALLMTHHLTGGRWGWSVRASAEGALWTLPLAAVLFLPVVAGVHGLYRWSHPAAVAQIPELAFKQEYLNVPFFIARAVLYFALWAVLALLLVRWSRGNRSAAAGDLEGTVRLRRLAAGGAVVWVLTTTFAAVDWVASLQAEWYSSIVGAYVFIGFALTAMAVLILLEADRADAAVRNDLGNLLLTLVVLHAYFAFSQFFIIWNGNRPHEIAWFVPRIQGPWLVLSVLIMTVHFALPFAALLFRAVKRDTRLLRTVAVVVLLARAVDAAWLVLPAHPSWSAGASLLPVAAMLGVALAAAAVLAAAGRRAAGGLS